MPRSDEEIREFSDNDFLDEESLPNPVPEPLVTPLGGAGAGAGSTGSVGGASDSIFAAKQYGSMANKTVMTSGQSMPGYFY